MEDGPVGTPAAVVPPTLGARLNRLFEVHRPPQAPERTWTNREVVTRCRAEGWELSESHLSELRRGVKQNPTLRTLGALAWFFEVRVGYFTDVEVAAEVEHELAAREAQLTAMLQAECAAREDVRAASRELQEALRVSGVTKMAHRGTANVAAAREQASMMRALARALLHEDEGDDTAAEHSRE
ncbi:MAG: hypothetical protein ACRDRL_15015 [Sciscionella sp.]